MTGSPVAADVWPSPGACSHPQRGAMTRWLGCAALAAVLAAGLAVRADKVTDSKAARAFGDLQAAFDKELKEAGRDAEKRQAVLAKFSPKFLDHAKRNARDDSAAFA